MSAARIFSKFKELLDVSWGTVTDGYFLKRSGANIVGVLPPVGPAGPAGPTGPAGSAGASGAPGSPGVAQIWRGEYNPATTYQVNDAVSYNGSSYVSTQITTGVAPEPDTVSNVLPPLANTDSRGSIAALPASSQAQYYARGDNTWQPMPDFLLGPASSGDGDLAVYNGTTGRLLGAASVLSKMPPGSVVQVQVGTYYLNANITGTQILTTDVIPTSSQGMEIIAVPFTPFFASSLLLVTFTGQFSVTVICTATAALFRDPGTSAIAAEGKAESVAQHLTGWNLQHPEPAGSTDPTVFRIRVGFNTTGTMRMNGTATGRAFGGVSKAMCTVWEIRQ